MARRHSSPTRRVRRRATSLLALALLAGSVSPGCDPPPPPAPNLLLIVVDTLRADRLGCYGYHRDLTPFVDSLAARGVRFENAYAPSSWTGPSVASLLTSRYPSEHGVTSFLSVLRGPNVTLPEVLQAHGFATAGVTANPFVNLRRGFAQGFDTFHVLPRTGKNPDTAPAAPAAAVNRLALDWLDSPAAGESSRFFLYLQYMEPHSPHVPPAALIEEILAGEPHPDIRRANTNVAPGVEVPPDIVRDLRNLYDVDVAWFDRQLRDFFTDLDRRGFLDDTLVVLTADHGEGLADHGPIGHGNSLFNEEIRVPLIVVPPGDHPPAVVAEPVSLIDIAPTLIELAHLRAPESFRGRSLRPHLLGGEGIASRLQRRLWRWLFGESSDVASELPMLPFGDRTRRFRHFTAVVDGPHKLIADDADERAYYDLEGDPTEANPDALSAGERASLEQKLVRFRARVDDETDATGAATRELDAATLESMRALGYAPQEP